jgi:hypothetical protein
MITNLPAKSEHGRRNILILISFFLCSAIFALYWQTLNHKFVFDDIWYVVKNPVVSKGLSLGGLRWAFSLSGKEAAYFHPLTWLSHMLDVEVYGLNPAGHHLTNIILHCLNTLLLLWLLVRFTKNVPASSIVALLFAVHPLNIETVAWVAERKNLLSTFCGLWTLCGKNQSRSLFARLSTVSSFFAGKTITGHSAAYSAPPGFLAAGTSPT